MNGLDQIDASRLRKTVGLFDSPEENEAIGSFCAARRIASRCGVPLVDALAAVLDRPTTTRTATSRERDWSPEPAPPTATWMRKVLLCRDAPHLFNADTREFLANIAAMRRAPSPAQLNWLDDLHARAVRHFQRDAAA